MNFEDAKVLHMPDDYDRDSATMSDKPYSYVSQVLSQGGESSAGGSTCRRDGQGASDAAEEGQSDSGCKIVLTAVPHHSEVNHLD